MMDWIIRAVLVVVLLTLLVAGFIGLAVLLALVWVTHWVLSELPFLEYPGDE